MSFLLVKISTKSKGSKQQILLKNVKINISLKTRQENIYIFFPDFDVPKMLEAFLQVNLIALPKIK